MPRTRMFRFRTANSDNFLLHDAHRGRVWRTRVIRRCQIWFWATESTIHSVFAPSFIDSILFSCLYHIFHQDGDGQDTEVVYVSQSLQRVPTARWRNFKYAICLPIPFGTNIYQFGANHSPEPNRRRATLPPTKVFL
jgi:hypothetical protein